jgi:hypothetical protein
VPGQVCDVCAGPAEIPRRRCYARAFNKSKGNPPLPAAPTSGLSPGERKTHEWALDERKKVWAHVDRDGHRRATDVQPGPPIAFTEEWIPPQPEQLEALAELGDKLQERYRAEAEALWHELQMRSKAQARCLPPCHLRVRKPAISSAVRIPYAPFRVTKSGRFGLVERVTCDRRAGNARSGAPASWRLIPRARSGRFEPMALAAGAASEAPPSRPG